MITTIRAKNFMAYKEIDLTLPEEDTSILVRGINHDILGSDSNMSGKTTLFEIIVFALFGRSSIRSKKKEELLRHGTKNGFAEIVLNLSHNDYNILVHRELQGSKFYFMIGDKKIEKGTTTHTQEELLSYLGYTIKQRKVAFEDFLRLTKISRTQIEEFIEGSPTENIRLLARIFGLEIWDYYLEEVQEFYNNNIKPTIQLYEERDLKHEREQEEEVRKDILANIESKESDKTELKRLLNTIQDKLRERIRLKDIIEELRTKKEELSRFKRQKQEHIDDLKKNLRKTEAEHTELVERITQADQTEKIDISEELLTLEKLKGREKELRSQHTELEREIESTIKAKDITANLLTLETRLAEGVYFSIDIDQLYRAINLSEEDRETFEELFIDSREAIIKDKYRTEHTLSCPSCHANLSYTQELGELLVFDEDTEIEKVCDLLDQWKKIKDKTIEYSKERNRMRENKDNTTLEIERIRDQIEGLQEKINAEKERTYSVESDKKAKRYKTETIDNLKRWIEKDIEQGNQAYRDKKAAIDKLKKEKEDLGSEEEYEKLRKQERELKDAINRVDNILKELLTDKGQREERIKTISESIQANEEILEQAELVAFLRQHIPRIKRNILFSRIPLLESLANEKLSEMDIPFTIRLHIIKEGRSAGGFYTTFISDNGEFAAMQQSSGGIRRIAYALLLSALEIGGNALFGFFILDEALDTLDETGRLSVSKTINNMQTQSFVVTHTSDINEIFQREILVEIRNGIAKANYRKKK